MPSRHHTPVVLRYLAAEYVPRVVLRRIVDAAKDVAPVRASSARPIGECQAAIAVVGCRRAAASYGVLGYRRALRMGPAFHATHHLARRPEPDSANRRRCLPVCWRPYRAVRVERRLEAGHGGQASR